MATKRCPHCQLVNPGSSQSCDCGYSFASGAIGQPLDLRKPGELRSSDANLNSLMRFLLFIGLITAAIALKIAFRR